LKGPSWIFQAYGAIKMNGGLTTEAEELLSKALEINDRDSAALATLAMLRVAQHQDEQAEKLFQESLEANPENGYALFNYAKFLFLANRIAEAKPHAELAVELDPRNRQVRDLLRKVLGALPASPDS
jgi:tetratricopeptide (TPR) repeat protein